MSNLLVFDIENTTISVGVFRGDVLTHQWQLSTAADRTPDEMMVLLKNLAREARVDLRQLQGAVVSSVVPSATSVIVETVRKSLGVDPLVVGPGVKTGLVIHYENPRDVGADRITNAVAAVHRFGRPVIVVDLRTATTLTVIDENGHYVGGVIAPGIRSAADALFQQAARLPQIDIVTPRHVIGKSTVTSMQSGVVFGFAALVDGLVERVRSEAPAAYRVVCTGPWARLIAPQCRTVTEMVPELTLQGLRLLWALNR